MELYDGEQWIKDNFLEALYYWKKKRAFLVKVKGKDVLLMFKFMPFIADQIYTMLKRNGYDVEIVDTEWVKENVKG